MKDARWEEAPPDDARGRLPYTLPSHLREDGGAFISQSGDGNVYIFPEAIPTGGGYRISSVVTGL
ncbi:MAG TPA: hypothetical protein H9684_09320 [Firmicutes bacterium]|nr:hypothetical protein [Bacillota bacterium]